MKINTKATNVELTDDIVTYLDKKLSSLEKLLVGAHEDSVFIAVEISKTTNHHKKGDFFGAEINCDMGGKLLRATAEDKDLFSALDVARDDLVEQIRTVKEKAKSKQKRVGSKVKTNIRKYN